MKTTPYRAAIIVYVLLQIFSGAPAQSQPAGNTPVRVAVAGISHGHVPWILGRKGKSDVILAGVYEPNKALAQRYADEFKLSKDLFYTDLAQMLDAVKPEAVVAFGSIYEHMAVVEACAPRGIHVMVEKPLATNNAHAEQMYALAKKHRIHLLTNYETSWYPTTAKTVQLARDSNFVGNIRKVVFHHGHQGPKEIGVNPEFFQWLTDPVQNGGGALIDFGCYGANIITHLMQGQDPVSVTAVTQQFKPAIYPKVDDEATIIVNYPSTQCIIQASWNWPFSRKDMEVYGDKGYIITRDNNNMRMKNSESKPEEAIRITAKEVPVYTDPFAYFADVIRGKITVPENGLYSLENNVKAVRILDAARESAKTGKTVLFKKK
jgi:predicted dehydrogenase